MLWSQLRSLTTAGEYKKYQSLKFIEQKRRDNVKMQKDYKHDAMLHEIFQRSVTLGKGRIVGGDVRGSCSYPGPCGDVMKGGNQDEVKQ